MSAKGWKTIAFVIAALIIAASPKAFAQTAQPTNTGQWIDAQTGKAVEVGPAGTRPDLTDPNRAYNPNTGASYSKGKDGAWKDDKTGQTVATVPIGARVDANDPSHAVHPGSGKNFYKPNAGAQMSQGGNPGLKQKLDAVVQRQQTLRDALPAWQSKTNGLEGDFEREKKKLDDMAGSGATPDEIAAQTKKKDQAALAAYNANFWLNDAQQKLEDLAKRIDDLRAGIDPDVKAAEMFVVEQPDLPPAEALDPSGAKPRTNSAMSYEEFLDEMYRSGWRPTEPEMKLETPKSEMKMGGDGKPAQMPKTQSMALPSTPSTFSNTSTMGNKGRTMKMKTRTPVISSTSSSSTGMNTITTSKGTTKNTGLGTGAKGKTVASTRTGRGGTTMNTTVGKPIIRIGGGGFGF